MEFPGPKPAGSSRQSKLLLERRTTARLAVHSPAYTSLDGSPPDKARDLSEIVDIGEGGISIQTSSALEVDRNLDLCLDLSETKARISTTGRVVWSNGAGRAGIRFQKLAGQSLRQLREWLFVNVLTAFDHSGGGTPSSASTERSRDSIGPSRFYDVQNAPPNGKSRNEPESVTPEVMRASFIEADDASNAVQNELNAGAYGLPASLQIIAERALTATRATGAAIALSTGEEMFCEASAGSDAPPVGSRLQASSGFSGECVRTGRSLRCDDSETDDRVDRAGCRTLGVRSIVAVPIRRGNRVVGLIEVFSSQPYAFTPEDISVLQQLSSTVLSVAGIRRKLTHLRPICRGRLRKKSEQCVSKSALTRASRNAPSKPGRWQRGRLSSTTGRHGLLRTRARATCWRDRWPRWNLPAPAISQDSAGRRCHYFSRGCGVVGCTLDFKPDP